MQRSQSRKLLESMDKNEAATIDNEVDDGLTPVENAAAIIAKIMQENVRKFGPRTKAALNFTLGVLKLSSGEASSAPQAFKQITRDETHSEVDIEVQDWLRANFTPEAIRPKSDLTATARFRKAGLGVFAAENILSLRKVSAARPANLPFEMDTEEEQKVVAKLEGIDRWDWDIFELESVCKDHVLEVVGWHLLQAWDMPNKFHISHITLHNWLAYVQSSYIDTEYHNATHAADVTQSVHFMLKTAKGKDFLSDVQVLALLLAAMVHDIGHDGCNNLYHKNKVTERAISFNDQSIQENFHAKNIFSQMSQVPEINIFQHFNANQHREMRRMLIELILATDMTKHFTMLTDVRNELDKRGPRAEDWAESQELLMATILHTCDVSNPAKPRPLAIKWTDRVLAEFFKQGDLEREQGLPVSPQCNRHTTSRAASQMGFIRFIIQPTFTVLSQILPTVKTIVLPTIRDNFQYWISIAENQEGIAVGGSFKSASEEEEQPAK